MARTGPSAPVTSTSSPECRTGEAKTRSSRRGPPPARDYQKELAAIVNRDHFFYPLLTQYALTSLVPPDPVFFVGDSMVRGLNAVSYTHLDVYKRQEQYQVP